MHFPTPTRRRLLALAILALALALRLWDINARALWFDEASEFWIATSSLAHLPASVRDGTGDPPLYSFFLHAWMHLGTGEIWLRLPSALLSATGVLGVMVLARSLGGGAAGLAAGALLALLPADVRYAQEVGQYGMIPALIVWNLIALTRLARGAQWRWILAWTATALAASYLYYGTLLAVMPPFACVVVVGVLRRDVPCRRATGTALTLYVLGALPLLYLLRAQLSRVVEAGGVSLPASGEGAGGLAGLIGAQWARICSLIAFQFTGWPHTHVPAALPVAAGLLLIGLCALGSLRLFGWLVAAGIAYRVADAAGVFPFGYRWGMTVTPLLVAAMGVGAAAAMRSPRLKFVGLAALAALVAVSAASLPNRTLRDRVYPDRMGAWPETEDMRVVVSFWRDHRIDGQPTYVYYGAAPAFAYYARALAPRTDLPPTWHLACWHDRDTPAFCREHDIYYGRWLRRFTAEEKVTSVFATLQAQPSAFWMVFAHLVPGDDRQMLDVLVKYGYRIESAVTATNASACLLVKM